MKSWYRSEIFAHKCVFNQNLTNTIIKKKHTNVYNITLI